MLLLRLAPLRRCRSYEPGRTDNLSSIRVFNPHMQFTFSKWDTRQEDDVSDSRD